MEPAHVVFLIGVALAVLTIAGYLIAITMILKHVVNRLVTILGAVEAVTKTSQPVGAIIDDINRDLDAGRRLMEDYVERLEQRTVSAGSADARHPADRHEAEAWGGGTATTTPATRSADPDAEPPAWSTQEQRGRGFWNR